MKMSDKRLQSLLRARWFVLLFLTLLLAGAAQRTALAHALLVRSEPEANAELTSAPPSIEMWFSEPLESRFSHTRLLDSTGEEVASAGPSVVDLTDATHMSFPLDGLTPGLYTVVWTTLSSVDGHEWIGSFPLTLLNPDGSRPAAGVTPVVDGATGEVPSPLKSVARWLSLLGAILLVGGLLFREGIARPVLARQPLPSLAAFLLGAWRLLGGVGIAGVLVGGWLQIGAQVAALGAPERLLDLLFATQPGRLLLLRQLLLLPAMALLVSGERPEQVGLPRSVLDRLSVVAEGLIGLVILATFSLASHAGAVPGRGWAVLGDFVHLVAAAAWMGGLLLLAALFWQSRRAASDGEMQGGLRQIVRRFSLLAAGAVFVLTATGLFSSAVQLPTFAALWRTTYGLLLVGKVALVALALGLAFFNNRSVHRPAADTTDTDGSQQLSRRVGIEALVSLGLLLMVALLVQTPPPFRPQAAVAPALPFFDIGQADDLLIHLQITPNQPGDNRFWAHLYHSDGSAIGEVQLVRLFFAPKQNELGQARADLPAEGDDIYVDEGAWMSQPGEWEVRVYVRRRGMDDATAQFSVTLPPPAGAVALGTPWENPAAGLSSSGVLGGLLFALGLIPFLWWDALSKRNRSATPLLGGVGLACLILGLFLTVRGMAFSSGAQVAERAPAVFIADIGATPSVETFSSLPTPVFSALPTPLPLLALPGATATPVPPTPNSSAPTAAPTETPTPDDVFLAGAALFQANCARCHGPHGMGDGPDATALPVQPAMLPFHVPMHPDENIYAFISEGFPSVGMPPFKQILSEDEIIQVVRYLRVRFGGRSP